MEINKSLNAAMAARGFLPVSAVADAIGVSRMTVYKWLEQGKVRGERALNRFWFVELASLRTFLGPQAAAGFFGGAKVPAKEG